MYGGEIHNRARTIRKAIGPDYPVLVKLNSQDFAENGLSLADSVRVGVILNDNGIDEVKGETLREHSKKSGKCGILFP